MKPDMRHRVARAILKARFYDPEPGMYDGLDDFFEAVTEDFSLGPDALREADAAIDAIAKAGVTVCDTCGELSND